ncbi:MAG TPA: hypothetical protein VGM37_15560 [Armatimonadota bacterium]|jgi:hypothetical protein
MRITALALLAAAIPAVAAPPVLPPEATVSRSNPTTLSFRWHSARNDPGAVEIWQGAGAHRTTAARNRNGGDYAATVTGLKPNAVTGFILSPQGDLVHSRPQKTATLEPKGTLETVTLPLLAVVYTPMHFADDAAAKENLSTADVARIKAQLEDVRQFYFRATHGKLNLVWTVRTDPTDVGNRPSLDAGEEIGGHFERSVNRILGEEKKRIQDIAGVVFLFGWAEGRSPEAAAKIYRGQAFSGGTYGWDAPWSLPETPYTLINFAHRADIRWTVTHEFGHQLDSMQDYSGHPSLAFNHPDPMTDVGRFGEHWDCNWWLLSRFPRDNWLALYRGQRHLSRDTDDDGLADTDPALPMDELRFHSNPRKADTDGDGLSDLREYTSSSGVYDGLNESWGARMAVDPRYPDSDGDGLKDGVDPYPQYPAAQNRRLFTPVVDGAWDKGEWQPAARIRVGGGFAEIGLEWDDNYLYVGMKSPKPLDLLVDLDANDDGWFAGTDNYRMAISAPADGSSEPTISSVIWDWSVYDEKKDPNPYLNQSKDIVKAADIRTVARSSAGGYVVEAAIPFNYHTGLRLYDGKRLGVKLSVRVPGTKVAYTAFEPQVLMEMVLAAKY